MNGAPPGAPRAGDYCMNFPVERPGDRDTARQAMKRNGCRAIRFEASEIQLETPEGPKQAFMLVAHGYVARMAGNEIEAL